MEIWNPKSLKTAGLVIPISIMMVSSGIQSTRRPHLTLNKRFEWTQYGLNAIKDGLATSRLTIALRCDVPNVQFIRLGCCIDYRSLDDPIGGPIVRYGLQLCALLF